MTRAKRSSGCVTNYLTSKSVSPVRKATCVELAKT